MNNQVLEYHLQVPSNDFSAEPVNGIEVSASNEEVQEEVQEEEPKANLPSLVSLWDRLKGNNFECVFAFVLFLFGILFMNKRSQRILGGNANTNESIFKWPWTWGLGDDARDNKEWYTSSGLCTSSSNLFMAFITGIGLYSY